MLEDKQNRTRRNKTHLEKVEWDAVEAHEIIAKFSAVKGGLMEALHGLQHAFGYIPEQSYDLLAEAFNLSRAEVYGVKTFYHDFKTAPTGHHVIQICQAESCQSKGSRALTRHVQERLGIKLGETTHDGHFTLEAVYCFGNCAVSPNLAIDGRLYGRMREDQFESLLKKTEAHS